ncbi:MAG TPA: Gfo/Idh/MocA family oxidoreductase, partial [Nannocystis sp.]
MRVGVIGTHWGRMHIGGFRGAGAEIAALCGRDLEATRRACAEEGVALATTDVGALCRAVDLVVVASPDRVHAAHVRAAIAAGCHVLCEKPLTRGVADAAALVELTAASDRTHAVNFPYRMLPPLRTLADWLRTRGPARATQVRVRNSFLSAGTGETDDDDAMLRASGDLGGLSHVIDAALWLLDARPRDVQATLRGRPVGDAGLLLRLDGGGTLAIAHVASVVPGIWGDWHIVGDDYEVRLAGGYVPALAGWQLGPVEVAGRDGTW